MSAASNSKLTRAPRADTGDAACASVPASPGPIHRTLQGVLRRKGIRHECMPGERGVSFRIDNGGASVTFLARREGELLLCAGHYALRVAEARLGDISEATNRINRLQMRGSFLLDFAEGRVLHRNTHWIGRRKATQREWEEVLDATVLAMFTWYPVFARILQGDDVVAELIQERLTALAADAP